MDPRPLEWTLVKKIEFAEYFERGLCIGIARGKGRRFWYSISRYQRHICIGMWYIFGGGHHDATTCIFE